jgi:hypothetical protein
METLDGKDAYRVEELHERGGPGRTFAFSEIKAGRLIARKAGRLTLVLREDFLAWLNALPVVGEAE